MGSVNVLPAAKVLELMGHTLVGAKIVGDNLVFTTLSGETFSAGNVRGPASTNRTATNTHFSPTAGVAATNVQAAIGELVGDITTITRDKSDASDVTKIASGEFIHPSEGEYFATKRVYNFPSNYFTSGPQVIVSPDTNDPNRIYGWTVSASTATNFTFWATLTTRNDTRYRWIAFGT